MVAATPALVVFRGFTVDDALISARMASHLAAGVGYRFNPNGPEVDAVTPLGWAHLLALGGTGTPLDMLERGRVVGVLGWIGAVAALGAFLARSPTIGRTTMLGVLAVSAPGAAWASSGMETGLVTLLSTLALAPGFGGALSGGVAAALRPELLPFSCVLAVGGALLVRCEPRRRVALVAGALLLSIGPAVLTALARFAWFGSAAPLALAAKPPDLGPGLRYALAGAVGTGVLPLLLAPLAVRRGGAPTLRVPAALLAHFAAIALAGGDWMPLYRLIVPVVPAALFAGAELSRHAALGWHGARVALAAAASVLVAWLVAWPARGVLANRLEFIAALDVALRDARVTAAVDAGMVGASTRGDVLDLAGVTDPSVARLPGGHTSKRFPEGLLEHRNVDHALLQLVPGTKARSPWYTSAFARAADARLASMPLLVERFEFSAELPLGRTPYRYILVARSTSLPR